MTKWFWYIILLMIFAPHLLHAKNVQNFHSNLFVVYHDVSINANYTLQRDTTVTKNKQRQSEEDKNKIKEIAKAKKMPKPEKIEVINPAKPKLKRQRRPEGLERPPEIPRRND